MKALTLLLLAGLLTGCAGGQKPFRQVQLCLADAADTARFIEVMQSVSESHHMEYHDVSTTSQKQLVTLKQAPGYPVLNISAHDEAGVGWGAGNLRLSAYDMTVGFSEGTNPVAAHAFAEDVIRRLSAKWTVYEVPSTRGALPRCGK
ncbi:hypothetical protein LVB87_00730 [Lysobacter sp. KIS68-7]|uniref:hypothetical protein n=1 Tax=Lysobacter sp. KIS68-7 TaxID=2904252 RepID=UPI001E4ECC9E|nr:hypothetical protein [Lysobacter sp. KIS68-7]UHQ19728.1 hypothetical protein LVB87_00730 [Lysobacter sp. KIS68-7]